MKTRMFLILLTIGLASCTRVPEQPSEPPILPVAASTQTSSLTPTIFPTDTATFIPSDNLSSTPRQTGPTSTPPNTVTPLPTLEPGQPVKLASIQMKDAKTGWGLQPDGHIVHTRDGAQTWQDVTPPEGSYLAGGLFSLDRDQAWATHLSGCPVDISSAPVSLPVWHTKDGGATWQTIGPSCPYQQGPYESSFFAPISIQFLDETTGWMLVVTGHMMSHDVYQIYQTTDGGNSWKMIQDNTGGPYAFAATGLAFLDAQTGWFGISNILSAASPGAWETVKTSDSGKTWEFPFLPAPSNLPDDLPSKYPWCGIEETSTVPPRAVDLTMKCLFIDMLSSQTDAVTLIYHYHSANAGVTWSVWQQTGDVQFIDPAVGWQLYSPGSNMPGQLQKTTDGGQTWTTIQKVTWPKVQLDFVDEQTGWAIVTGPDNGYALIQTTDDGKTWTDLKAKIEP